MTGYPVTLFKGVNKQSASLSAPLNNVKYTMSCIYVFLAYKKIKFWVTSHFKINIMGLLGDHFKISQGGSERAGEVLSEPLNIDSYTRDGTQNGAFFKGTVSLF